jgi:hypothetical protein
MKNKMKNEIKSKIQNSKFKIKIIKNSNKRKKQK